MNDQVDATNKVLREGGVIPPGGGEPAAAAPTGRPELPKIRIPGRNRTLAEFAKDVGGVMCQNGVFLRGDVPMVLNKHEKRLKELTGSAFRSYVDNHAQLFYHESGGKDDGPREVRVTMAKDIASDTLRSYNFLDLQRQIRRVNVVPMPVMRQDGAISLLGDGYDYESQVLTMPSGMNYEVMPVDEAKTLLVEFFKYFEFEGRDDAGFSRSLNAHVSAMLTPFCLGLLSPLSLVPMFIYTANTRRGGKTLLVKTVLYPCYGTAPAASFGKDDEELRKLLDTKALQASSFIFFDNVKRRISSAYLEAFLTQPTWSGRVMSTQKEFSVDKQAIVFVTSNHVETSPDIAGRALFVDLFVESTDIQTREFPFVINDNYLMQPSVRRSLLSALWSMVVHWDRSGRPGGKRKLVGFEEWGYLLGGIVMAAGFGDPLEPPQLEYGNTEWKDMEALVTQLANELGDEEESHEFLFQQVIELCVEEDLFVEKIDGKWIRPQPHKDETGKEHQVPHYYELQKKSSISLGRLFREYIGRVFKVVDVGQIRFGRRGSKNARRFSIERVPEVDPKSP